MHEASIGKQQEDLARTIGSTAKEFAQEVWSAPKLIGEPLNKQPDHNLPDLKITDESHLERKGHGQATHLEPAKERLLKKLDENFDKDSTEGFKSYMHSFEKRASANQLSKQELAETYQQINRILSAAGDKPLTAEQRKQVVRETLHHCADPEIISQGQHNTCNVTAVQVRAYSLHPSIAAKLVADVSTTGEYTTPRGIKVKLNTQSMVPDREARASRPELGWRDYATQLFNLAAVNVWYAAAKPEWHYEQRIEKNAETQKENVREQIVDHGKPVLYPNSEKPLDSPTLGADQIAFINDAIVGKHEPYAVLAMNDSHAVLPGVKKQSARAADIVDEGHLKSLLEDLKNKHQLPTIAAVETGVYPLNVDSGSPIFGYANGGHVVNITDFAGGKNPHVSVDNEWSPKADHPNNSVALHDMYLCIGGAQVARTDAGCDLIDAESKHIAAPVAEITSLASDAGAFGADTQYANDAAKKITKLSDSEKALTGESRTKWFSELRSLLGCINAEDKVGLLRKIQNSSACTQAELGWLAADSAKSISHQKKVACHNNNANRKRACTKATTQIAEFVVGLPGEVKKHYFAKLREND